MPRRNHVPVLYEIRQRQRAYATHLKALEALEALEARILVRPRNLSARLIHGAATDSIHNSQIPVPRTLTKLLPPGLQSTPAVHWPCRPPADARAPETMSLTGACHTCLYPATSSVRPSVRPSLDTPNFQFSRERKIHTSL